MTALRLVGFRIAIVCVGLLGVLAVAEAVTRAMGLAPALVEGVHYVRDSHLPFRPAPSSRATGRAPTGEYDFDYRHNSLGFRDVEHPAIKAPDVVRVLGLGDSFTYGSGVAFEETYLARVEARLGARPGSHPRVEIVKAGIPRFFPEAERLLLEHIGLPLRPDLVVVGFLPNDVVDTYLGLDSVIPDRAGRLITREAAALGPLAVSLHDHSHLARIALHRYVGWRRALRFRPRIDEIYRADGYHERDWRVVEAEYDRMSALAASVGARLVVLHIPQRGPWSEPDRYPATRLEAWSRTRGAAFVDALPALERAAPGARLYYERDGHLTAAGHAVVAGELTRHLEERLP